MAFLWGYVKVLPVSHSKLVTTQVEPVVQHFRDKSLYKR